MVYKIMKTNLEKLRVGRIRSEQREEIRMHWGAGDISSEHLQRSRDSEVISVFYLADGWEIQRIQCHMLYHTISYYRPYLQ